MSRGEHLELGDIDRTNDPKLIVAVSNLLEVSISTLDGWRINRIRDDGAIDAEIPIEQIDVSNVPTDPDNVDWLKGLFDERAAQVGGTGQRDPVVIGNVASEGLFMLDGFHRHEVQRLRGVGLLHSTVECGLDYKTVVKRRLEYAHTHPEIELPRQVEWLQSAWERTDFASKIPNVVTAFRACQDDYAFSKTDDVELLDSLSEELFEQIREWVFDMCKELGQSPTELRKKLAQIYGFDRGSLSRLYSRQGPAPAGRINLGHVSAIVSHYPGEPDLHGPVVDLVIAHQLTPVQTKDFLHQLDAGRPMYPEDIIEIAEGLDFSSIKGRPPSPKRGKNSKRYSNNRKSEEAGDEELSANEILAYVHERLERITDEAGKGRLALESYDHALKIALALSEIVASQTIRLEQTKKVIE